MIGPLQIIITCFNFLNVFLDWHRIEVLDKRIAHGLNGAGYLLVIAFCIYHFELSFWQSFFFTWSAFFNRQLTFDIPLNLRRGLSPWYQSVANPPKAIMDRIERKLFGHIGGKSLALIYFIGFIVTLILQFIV